MAEQQGQDREAGKAEEDEEDEAGCESCFREGLGSEEEEEQVQDLEGDSFQVTILWLFLVPPPLDLLP